MSQPPPYSPAPPGWHFQPILGRWLWWDGYRWIDPAAGAYGAVPGASERRAEAPHTWWPAMAPIGFGAAIVGTVFIVAMFVAQLWIGTLDAESAGVALLALGFLAVSQIGMPAVGFWASSKFGSEGALRSIDFRFHWLDALLAIPTAIAMTIMMVIINMFWTVGGGDVGTNLEDLQSGGADPVEFALMFVIAGLVAPVIEEILFRGAIFRGLMSKMPLWPALIVQGIIFGAMHYTPGQGWANLNLIVSLSALGVALGVVTKATGRLGLAILAHAVFNMSQLALLWFSL